MLGTHEEQRPLVGEAVGRVVGVLTLVRADDAVELALAEGDDAAGVFLRAGLDGLVVLGGRHCIVLVSVGFWC